jgi:hypothetical protein
MAKHFFQRSVCGDNVCWDAQPWAAAAAAAAAPCQRTSVTLCGSWMLATPTDKTMLETGLIDEPIFHAECNNFSMIC